MNIFEGNIVAKDVKIGIVAARFNEFITSKLFPMNVLLKKEVRMDDEKIA